MELMIARVLASVRLLVLALIAAMVLLILQLRNVTRLIQNVLVVEHVIVRAIVRIAVMIR
jgi:hypothetical protein